jgi:small GTP-binding protein
MPINASYEYFNAEKAYLEAKTTEDKIAGLEEMIKASPKHKGTENLLAELKTRLKKLREKQEKSKKVGKGRKGIKKEGYQVVLLGFTNSGKSMLLSKLTNAKPEIGHNKFTTQEPQIGTLGHQGVKAQVVDLPSLGSEFFDIGIVNTADSIIIVITSLDEIPQITPKLTKSQGKVIVAINKIDLLSDEQLRKLEATIKSKKINGILISALTEKGITELKDKIFSEMEAIRVFTKEPGKPKSPLPIVLPKGSTVRTVAESILNGFSRMIKETRLTGPSGKFPNQKVSLDHVLKDQDIVEFHRK